MDRFTWVEEKENQMIEKRELPPTGILQEWVAKLGLREQGVLLTAVRGCDTCPKEDPMKDLSRAFRGEILNTHCKDPTKAVSFIELCEPEELMRRQNIVAGSIDHYPHHFVMHLIHAVEILGYHHPARAPYWQAFYVILCNGLHMIPETKIECQSRLGATEETFDQ